MIRFRPTSLFVVLCILAPIPLRAAEEDKRFPLFAYLTGKPTPTMIAYTPSQLDPRQDANQRRLATSSIRADLEALRPGFDGLVLYGYHEACTPRVLAVAKQLHYRAVVLAIWDPKSAAEVDGVAALARQHQEDFAVGVLVGNEGLTFKRYEPDDVRFAAARLRRQLPPTIPLATSEPLVGYGTPFVREFGDFLAPNIHPVFDRPPLGPEQAAAWAREQAARLAQEAKKPVFLKETGFPHAGKGMYTPASQQAFWAAYVKPGVTTRPTAAAGNWSFHGVAFEAFDLPWKEADSQLPIEKSWGLLSPKREPYPAFAVWRGLAGQAAGVSITVDVAQVPELADWGEQAKTLCLKWYPLLTEYLQSEGFTPPALVKIVFKKDMKGVASTSGTTITISAQWVRDHPDDFGMVIHELTHVVQSYPKYDPVWLIEGIADYLRYWHFEPKPIRIDPLKASFRDGYGTAGAFLAWLERTQDKKIIGKLNQALRAGTCKEAIFKELTGKDVEQLWSDFVQAQRAR